MAQTIVLLSGWSTAGKDTIGSVLVEQYGFTRCAFGDIVKDEVARDLGFDRRLCDTQEGKKLYVGGLSIREHLIQYGENGRNANPEYWAIKLAEIIQGTFAPIVITDWRHMDELYGLQKILAADTRFIPCRVEREGLLVSPVPHKTEYSLMGFPFAMTFRNKIYKDPTANKAFLNQQVSLFVKGVIRDEE